MVSPYLPDLAPKTVDVLKLRAAADAHNTSSELHTKTKFDTKRAHPCFYKIGVLVVVKISSIVTKGDSKKLLPKCKGSFKITKCLPFDRYEVQHLKTISSARKYTSVYAVEHIKPWFSSCSSSDEE